MREWDSDGIFGGNVRTKMLRLNIERSLGLKDPGALFLFTGKMADFEWENCN